MISYLPSLLVDFATILSVVSSFVSFYLLWVAKEIRKTFLRKVRFPELVSDLNNVFQEIFNHLKKYDNEYRLVHEKINKAKGILEAFGGVAGDGRIAEEIQFSLNMMKNVSLSVNGEDGCWEIYAELSRLLSFLDQSAKDAKWG